MKKRSIVKAYESIHPDEEAKERMLRNILSSKISLAGKDERKMRKGMKPVVVTAIIIVMLLMMGCAIVAIRLQDWKVGELTNGRGQILDKDGNVLIEKNLAMDMISLHGFTDSPTYLAQQEWFEFEKTYDPDLEILAVNDDYTAPEAYDAYNVYSDEMVAKVDEIAEKYDLNLLGPIALCQRWERSTFLECLNIDSLLIPDTKAAVTEMSGYFYEGCNFEVEFDMEMGDSENAWPYTMYNTIYYSRKDNFDDTYMNVGNMELWDQWTYTTSSGFDVLIASSDYGALVFCMKEDSIIFVQIDNCYETDYNYDTQSFDTRIVMTKEQLKMVIEQIDFSIEVKSVNMELAREKLEWFTNKG